MASLLNKLFILSLITISSFATDTVMQTDRLILGQKSTGATTDKQIVFQNGTANLPVLKWNKTTSKLNFSHDGTTFKQINKALDLDTTGVSANKFLIGDGSGGVTTRSPLATELDTTGVASGYVLTSNGSGAMTPVDPATITPRGAVTAYAGTTLPTGWIECNGDVVPNGTGTVQGVTANFSALYALLASTYGSAGKLPDLRGRSPIGSGTGSGLSPRTQGIPGGEENHTLTVGEMPSHRHAWSINYNAGSNAGAQGNGPNSGLDSFSTNTDYTGGSGSHNNMMPYLPIKYIIKY